MLIPITPITMKGAASKPAGLVAVGENEGGAGASVRTFLKALSSLTLNGISPSCSSTGTSLRITAEANICLIGVVGVDLGGVLRNLHGDIAGEGAARQDHRIAPHRGGAILGVFRGVVGKADRVSMLSGLMPPVPPGLALKAFMTSP